MKIEKITIPEKLFGMETGLLIVFAPLFGVVLLVIISVNLLILPRISDYSQMVSQLNVLGQQRQELIQKKTYLLSVDQDALKKNSDFVVNALLPQNNSYLLVGMVGKIANSYDYQIDSFLINPGDITKNTDKSAINGVANIPVSLMLVGPANKYLNLVKGLESSLPILSLDSFKMQSDGSVAKMELTISAYYTEASSTVDISKLSLADLTLSKDESDLITKLSGFTVLENVDDLESGFSTGKTFVKYNRTDPFTP